MAIDATGTPTPLGIPKFNTAVDAPSGKGGNAQMDAIDLLIAGLPVKPAGLATGEFMTYDAGTVTFKRSTVQRPGMDSLGTGTPDNTKFLRGDGSWQALGATYGTTLPATPTDGQEAVLVASLTNPTYQWRFRYNAGSALRDKWEYVGGITQPVQVDALETTASTTYVALTTAGPAFTVPRLGIYVVDTGMDIGSVTAAAHSFMSYDTAAAKGAVTVTIASPAVFTNTAHGLAANDAVYFTTDGALPTGLTPFTIYFVIAAGLTANNFEVSTTVGGAAVNTSGTQSGTHSLLKVTGAVDADAVQHEAGAANVNRWYGLMRRRFQDLPAGTQVTSKYRTTAGTAGFENRWLSVIPVRVS